MTVGISGQNIRELFEQCMMVCEAGAAKRTVRHQIGTPQQAYTLSLRSSVNKTVTVTLYQHT
jgi:hypothetical protein